MKFVIGYDNSLEETDDNGEAQDRDVYIESHDGTVDISGPSGNWMGYEILAELPEDQDAHDLAAKIAANPVSELSALGYDCDGWLTQATKNG